jgi:hypothetical protein
MRRASAADGWSGVGSSPRNHPAGRRYSAAHFASSTAVRCRSPVSSADTAERGMPRAAAASAWVIRASVRAWRSRPPIAVSAIPLPQLERL